MELTIKGTPEEVKKALQAISGSKERKTCFIGRGGSLGRRVNLDDHN